MSYEPGPLPTVGEDLGLYIQDELRKLAASFSTVENILLQELNVAPEKPRNGMMILADGTNFNPTEVKEVWSAIGAGFYGRRGGVWVKLG